MSLQVWASAHALAGVLAAEAGPLLAARRVLELGSGCGITGILAAKLGAEQVKITLTLEMPEFCAARRPGEARRSLSLSRRRSGV